MRYLAYFAGAVLITWLICTPYLLATLDYVTKVKEADLPIQWLASDPNYLTVGSRNWVRPEGVRIAPDAKNRLTMYFPSQTFVLGPVIECAGDYYRYKPEAGDQLSFVMSRSRGIWATPFDIAWLGGTLPRLHRHTYYRLSWVKADKSRLEITWKDKQDFYRNQGWTDAYLSKPPSVKLRQ